MALEHGGLVERAATRWTTRDGVALEVTLHVHPDARMIVLRHGEVGPEDTPLVRLHSACLTSEALGSTRCDCREQLDEAIRRIGAEGKGLVVYFLDHEGRGIGIEAKLAAYALQDAGKDTVEANLALGLPVDDRDFSPAVGVLDSFGLHRVRLMTNNPVKVRAVEAGGIAVDRESAWVAAPAHAAAYLRQKVLAMSHLR